MMAFRLIVFVSSLVLANGCGKGDPTPCPTTIKPTPCPTTPPRDVKKHYGEFVYELSHPTRVRFTFLATHEVRPEDYMRIYRSVHVGMFSIECGDGTPYQTPWFDLHPNAEDPASINAVPASGFARELYNARLAGVRAACPDARIEEGDFESFEVDEDGNAHTLFEGARILLNRIWLPYIRRAEFVTDPVNLPKVSMHIWVDPNTIIILFTCNNTMSNDLWFRLEGMGLGKAYKLKLKWPGMFPGHPQNTFDDLINELKQSCPNLPDEYYSVKRWDTVRFAPDSIFFTGNYITDRAYRKLDTDWNR
ncbi:hypothetical protein FOZ63_021322 [Perkinsus olseni]|uniref:Uncharacterized protein n=1 Tax=Perkinsus olseni TaxID=32597 RepID=A0A7J6S3D4_PEROL|nr:hypothetical protein FOZ63_021322 [Perkinsus olseni]KAF4727469.1 hypothetical protein FOZ62_006102 [Perkinsus olseni]